MKQFVASIHALLFVVNLVAQPVGQAVSSLGTALSQVAFPLLVLALTNSPFQAGLAGALRLLPDTSPYDAGSPAKLMKSVYLLAIR